MTATTKSTVSIYIAAAGTNPSAATATTNKITGEIASYDVSGGDAQMDSKAVFGGFVKIKKPANMIEVKLDIIPSLENANLWDAMIYSAVGSVYTSNTVGGTDKAIFIQSQNGSTTKSWAWNNASGLSIEQTNPADENLGYTITFNVTPVTEAGVANFQTMASTIVAMSNWSALTS